MLLIEYVAALVAIAVATAVVAYPTENVLDLADVQPEAAPGQLRLWVTISARRRFVEVSWQHAPARSEDRVFLTTQEPRSFEKVKAFTGTRLAALDNAEGSGFVPADGVTSRTTLATSNPLKEEDSGSGDGHFSAFDPSADRYYWTSNNGGNNVVAAIQPMAKAEWFTTGVPFDYALSKEVTIDTGCYGFWASYVNSSGGIEATSCLRAYPRWMRDLRSVVGGFRMRDLFIPGTHDSGSYRPIANFHPLQQETLVTKYALTQDDDIRGQLLHGARYLDIRVGYYRNDPERFYINHGVVKQRPLSEIIEQVKEFVLETNEIVIFGLKEFPVGFGKGPGVHRLLVSYLKEAFGELIVHPSLSWRASLHDIWSRKQNVILAYDKGEVVREFPQTLFGSVEQRWGDVRNWSKLEKFLRLINTFDVSRLSSRPVADMAELTPDTLGVILDKYGGLRKMADDVNWRVSRLYRDELGKNANIVAVDFMRGTSIVEIAIEWNKRKVIY